MQAKNQLFDNIAGVDACGSLTNIDTILGREAAAWCRSCPQRLRQLTCHIVGRSLVSSTDSCWNPVESGPFRPFRGNGILAEESAKMAISIPPEWEPDFSFRWNGIGIPGMEWHPELTGMEFGDVVNLFNTYI